MAAVNRYTEGPLLEVSRLGVRRRGEKEKKMNKT